MNAQGMRTMGESDHTEGAVARRIEEQTARMPSDTFLWAALGSIAASATMQVAGWRQGSLFVGQWAPVFLMLGVYNKLVKELGTDYSARASA